MIYIRMFQKCTKIGDANLQNFFNHNWMWHTLVSIWKNF